MKCVNALYPTRLTIRGEKHLSVMKYLEGDGSLRQFLGSFT